jgi:acylphosphatase
MEERVVLKIFGLVQGVAFRYFLKTQADNLTIVGFAKNEADGTITVIAEGKKEKLELFVKHCHEGPPEAKVEKITLIWDNPTGQFTDFKAI